MASKQVIARQRGAETVLSVVRAQAQALTRESSRILHEGVEQAFDLPAVVSGCELALARLRDALVAADTALERELGDDDAVRAARDEVAAVIRSRLVESREILTGLYGSDVSRPIFAGEMPDDVTTLARYTNEVGARLRATKLGDSRVPGAQLDAAALADGLVALGNKLDEALAAVADEVREAQVLREARNVKMAAFDQTFTAVATIFEGLFLLSGQRELANRVRPSRRRPGTTAEEPEPTPTPVL